MGRQTRIEWCDSTVNPTGGCDGCELWNHRRGGSCYAAAIHNRFAGSAAFPQPFDEVVLRPGRMQVAAEWSDLRGTKRPDKPWLDGLPRCVFIGDMGDSFAANVPLKYLAEEVIRNTTSAAGRRHRWLWLTKKPGRMVKLGAYLRRRGVSWPDNLMPMTSIRSWRPWRAGVYDVDVRGRLGGGWGVSAEPLLQPVELDFGPEGFHLKWLIVGCESRGNRVGRLWSGTQKSAPTWFEATALQTDESAWMSWACAIAGEALEARVPLFVKQIPHKGELLRDWRKFPAELRFREMPALVTGAVRQAV